MISCLLVANRGEIAVRILRAASDLGIRTVAVYSPDDALSLHTRRADIAVALGGAGAAAYLDGDQILSVARENGCEAVHPGYGFLSEQAAFAARCAREGVTFVGPRPETLATFGDKIRARTLAEQCGVPVLRGVAEPAGPDEAREFLASLAGGAMMIKAVAGGGGRGMRIVTDAGAVEEAFVRCRSEALQSFGNGDLYVEEAMSLARHVEVQIAGDGTGEVVHLWERECSLQRRHQKLIEVAPCPALTPELRERLCADALRMAKAADYLNLGTFEFLVDASVSPSNAAYAFIEANPRLQVEHTVTEEVLDLDLVQIQLAIAGGGTLAGAGLVQSRLAFPRGYAVQVRINAETMDTEGTVRPAGGTLTSFEVPSGRGIRVDSYGYAGYRINPNFDPLLAKLVCRPATPDFAGVIASTYRALSEFRIEGVRTNIPLLQNLLQHPDVAADRVHTRFVEENLTTLAAPTAGLHRQLFFDRAQAPARAGAQIDAADPLAVLLYGRSAVGGEAQRAGTDGFETSTGGPFDPAGPEGSTAVRAPMQATVIAVAVAEGDLVAAGEQLLVLSAMKMEHVIAAPVAGVVRQVAVAAGDTLYEGEPLLFLEEREATADDAAGAASVDLDAVRPDLAEVMRRRAIVTLDASRPEAVVRRHAQGHRTARENLADLCDPGTFVEYGALALAQGLKGTVDEILQYAPADGMIMGLGHVNGELFDETCSRCVVISYDYMVLAGTQGGMNHRKKDRMFEVAEQLRSPLVFFTEGGGGRAGGGSRNTAGAGSTGERAGGGGGLGIMTWNRLGRLSGLVPIVGINSGFCFAGNAAILGCCDVVIATADSNIGMGGPAMIEGGGLGVFRPEEVGPMSVQVPNGVVDIPVEDEAAAVSAAKRYLSYFQGPLRTWECADQRLMRGIVPENRLRVYDVRRVIETLADTGSVLELRRGFGTAMITSLIRVEGRPVGVIANNPVHLSGAIDSPAADKAARFMQLCDAFDLPILMLCDTPGIMVGPEVEKTALVRHAARMFVMGASLTVPVFTIILRKAYGLGAMTMGGGSHRLPIFTVSWPTGEFGGMGLEGQVKLGRRRELESIETAEARQELYERLVAEAYERGRALNAAHVFDVEDVIDPADSRRFLLAGLKALPPLPLRTTKKRPCVDAW